MDKHLTEIEIFEYANRLIEEKEALQAIESHLNNCNNCSDKVKIEQNFTIKLKKAIEVKKQVSLNDKIVEYFTVKKLNSIETATNENVYVILFLSAILLIIYMIEFKTKNLPLSLVYTVFISIVSLLFVELLWKYIRYKKKHPIF